MTVKHAGPLVIGEPAFVYNPSLESRMITYEKARAVISGRDKIELIPSHCDPVVICTTDLAIRGETRGGRLWPIAARGPSA